MLPSTTTSFDAVIEPRAGVWDNGGQAGNEVSSRFSTFSTLLYESHVDNLPILGKVGFGMNISVPLEDGLLPDRFGKYSPEDLRKDGNNINSFPVCIEGVPAAAKSLALTFVDYDSVPVCGFVWIHWAACGIDPATKSIPEGASHSGSFAFTQGANSCLSRADETSRDVINGYIGPCPPDKNHRYTLCVSALDCELELPEGFYFNDLHWAMEGHVLDSATLNIESRA